MVEVSSCDRHSVGLFFSSFFSLKKIFVKGLKFKEAQCVLQRKIPVPCKMKIAHQNLWGRHISASVTNTAFAPGSAPRPLLACSPAGPPSGGEGFREGPARGSGVGRERGCLLETPAKPHSWETN